MGLSCELLRDAHALSALTEAWWALLRRSGSDEPMLSPLWLQRWWQVFGGSDGRELAVLAWHAEQQLVGLLPLLRRRHWYRGVMPLRRLELLASGEPERDEIASEYLGPIFAAELEQQLSADLATRLLDGSLGAWDELVLPALRDDQPWIAPLCAALRARGLHCELTPHDEVHYVPLPASWDEYLGALSAKSRYLVRRSLRDTERWAGGVLRFEQVTEPAQLARGQQVLAALHGARWSQGQTDAGPDAGGAFASPRFCAFHAAVLPELLARGALELRWLEARGEPIAVVYNLVWNGKVYAYQSGRQPGLPATVRVGVAIHADAIRRAIERGLREYDLLGGPARYKRQLGLATRRLVRLRVVQPGWRERLREGAERVVAATRPWLRHGRNAGTSDAQTAAPASLVVDADDGAES